MVPVSGGGGSFKIYFKTAQFFIPSITQINLALEPKPKN